jgi:glycosyltransferase involved in cell wall biosynthesis
MRVAPDFLPPLLAAFDAPDVFAVASQIFFSDPAKPRQETGLTQGWWQDGLLRVRHRLDPQVTGLFPCFYPGGGSSAFDRRKFLELGGFDHLLAPFYLEDTDTGYAAWKRGWRVLYQPASHVWHEHRGTIGKKFSAAYIDSIVEKNFLLWVWKNIHHPSRMVTHLAMAAAGAAVSLFAGPSRERVSLRGLARAVRQLPALMVSRWRARSLSVIQDGEAFERPMGGYYRDQYLAPSVLPERPSVLMVCPYGIEPPTHGGAVFMSQTARQLARLADLHLIILTDTEEERRQHEATCTYASSLAFLVRLRPDERQFASPLPHAVREYANRDLEWLIHRQLYMKQANVLQLEYTNMGQYACGFRRIVTCLFEHDIYFQSVARRLARPGAVLARVSAAFEYLRSLRWELTMLQRVDRIQVCTAANARYLEGFQPSLAPRIDANVRAGIDSSRYTYCESGRERDTMLFLGSFRHIPNQEALSWFVTEVLPWIRDLRPTARLVIVGSDPPPAHSVPSLGGALELRGFVEDVRTPLAECALFVCPILAGSGVRVKLLEAFAAGIPVVSTRLGAEGLSDEDGHLCRLADDAEAFARAVVAELESPNLEMTRRARQEVETNWDIRVLTERLVETYRNARNQP